MRNYVSSHVTVFNQPSQSAEGVVSSSPMTALTAVDQVRSSTFRVRDFGRVGSSLFRKRPPINNNGKRQTDEKLAYNRRVR